MNFQDVIMRLNEFWADQGCLLWQPYNIQVGAGTYNPATALRVLGPEPWNVAYVEPSVRPDDGRYGENPNRWNQYYQYQVILKPDPGNPLEIYLDSLRALGIDASKHDVRFVEDNWESPALGAWGLGWEVWLDGQEITQYTYFQQAGGQSLEPVSIEITYGLERIVMVLQGVRGFTSIRWTDRITYGDLLLRGEIEACTYNFEIANVDNLRQMYDLCEAEARSSLAHGLVMPAHDYVLKCSHLFNILDTRGAIGVTERARYFARMRDLAREVAALYAAQREQEGYPLMKAFAAPRLNAGPLPAPTQPAGKGPFDLVFEIGCEELPAGDLDDGIAQLQGSLVKALAEARLGYQSLRVLGTPRRLAALVRGLAARQSDRTSVLRGPAANIAYDAAGNPTKAALGFARSRGVDVTQLERRDIDGKEYVVAVLTEEGQPASLVLAMLLPEVVASLRFQKSMRWNASGVSFSRPIRWYVALLDDVVIPFEYAGVRSGRVSRGIRPLGSPDLTIPSAAAYEAMMADAGILLDAATREAAVLERARPLAEEVGGELACDADLLREVANLVECPLPIRGTFDESYLRLPDAVLLAVMRKHQRYLPIMRQGKLLPYFIAIANGATLDQEAVRFGNEEVLRARYADATYFYDADCKKKLADLTPRLDTLMFQEDLGSMLAKVRRLERLAPALGEMLGMDEAAIETTTRGAALCKSDLATQLVVEFTSLQGIMGRHYAMLNGEPPDVAQVIEEHYLPRYVGDRLPESLPGMVVGLADRLDTLVGLFTVNVRPSGAADPWGLRRAALGIVQLLVGKEISLSLREAIRRAAAELPIEAGIKAQEEVLDYILRRYEGYLLEQGYRYDMVAAVLNAQGEDPYRAYGTLQAFQPWVEREDWQELLDSYARCVRITRDQPTTYAVEPERFIEPASRALYESYCAARAAVDADPSIDGLFKALQGMIPAIRRFFDDVLVMDPDDTLRQNRLGLLQAIGGLTAGIVDLTVLEGF